MSRRRCWLLLVCIAVCAVWLPGGVRAQAAPPALGYTLPTAPAVEAPTSALSGDLRADLLRLESPGGAVTGGGGERSVPLALLLSAVLPGAGQAYNGAWVRTAVFAGLEAGLWTGYFVWKTRGEDGRDAYQAFAHRDWSATRYADWLLVYPGFPDASTQWQNLETARVNAAGIDLTQPNAWTSSERQRVFALFTAIRAAERITVNDPGLGGSGATFSHTLPDFGEQQYYELIGKYFQYNPGWADWAAENPTGTDAYLTLPLSEAEATDQLLDYQDDHSSANTLLRQSTRAVSFVVANHFFAALDAALTARLHNLRLDTGVSLAPGPSGEVLTQARLRWTF